MNKKSREKKVENTMKYINDNDNDVSHSIPLYWSGSPNWNISSSYYLCSSSFYLLLLFSLAPEFAPLFALSQFGNKNNNGKSFQWISHITRHTTQSIQSSTHSIHCSLLCCCCWCCCCGYNMDMDSFWLLFICFVVLFFIIILFFRSPIEFS